MACLGRNEWWRYVIAILGAIIGLPFILVMLISFVGGLAGVDLELAGPSAADDFAAALSFAVLLTMFAPFLLGAVVAVTLLHRRSVRSLMTGFDHFPVARISGQPDCDHRLATG